MRILSLLMLIALLFFARQQTKSPHGSAFKVGCGKCHSPNGWQLDKSVYSFDHSITKLPLEGQHKETDCRLCHKSLVFTDAASECNECHIDIHQATTGSDCSNCHTPASWLVNNISEIHRIGRFPLLGAHRMADCAGCHKSERLARFDVLGVECINCHRDDFISTTTPNHIEAEFSEDCSICHPVNSFQWTGKGFNHNFFALVEGHSTPQCADCHTSGRYSDTGPECNSCHQQDYLATTNPDHTASDFPTTCDDCHTLAPEWKPASFDHTMFPLTKGHSGLACADCHSNPSNYQVFTCITCHEHNKADMDKKHEEESGYSYDNTSCLRCHPAGVAD